MNQELRRKLTRITNILWAGGVTNPVTYIEQISYLIYLKLLDEEESSRELRSRLMGEKTNGNNKSLFPKQAERYRWIKWRFKSGPDLRNFLRDEVFPYMASLVKEEPQIAEYFRDAVLEITDPNVLKQVVDEIDSIDFAKLGTDVKGDIFEYLLTHLGQSALNGQFRTPRQIRTMMVEMVNPEEDLARRYKVILSNPPFAGVLPKESIRKDLPTNSKKSGLLFLGVMMEALAPGGRCAVVVPEGLLFGSTSAHKELRRKLVEDFDLLALVSLPAGVFKPYAGVKTGRRSGLPTAKWQRKERQEG